MFCGIDKYFQKALFVHPVKLLKNDQESIIKYLMNESKRLTLMIHHYHISYTIKWSIFMNQKESEDSVILQCLYTTQTCSCNLGVYVYISSLPYLTLMGSPQCLRIYWCGSQLWKVKAFCLRASTKNVCLCMFLWLNTVVRCI